MPSRRRLLQAVSASIVGVAGCATSDDTDGSGDSTPNETITDPATVTVRNPGAERAVRMSGGETLTGDELLRTRRAADDLSLAAGVSTDDVTAFERFLDDTSFDSETLFVTQSWPESCQAYRVQSLYWSPRWIELDYCQTLRAPDVPCAVDRRDAVAVFVRVPGEVSRDPTIRTGNASSCPDTEYAVIDATATNGTAADATATETTAASTATADAATSNATATETTVASTTADSLCDGDGP